MPIRTTCRHRRISSTGVAAGCLGAAMVIAAFSPATPVLGDDAPGLPRFASIQASEANMRTGPGRQYPVEYVYRRPELPVQIIAEFDIWRRIRDVDGDIGWVHQAMLSGRRTVMVLGPDIAMMRGEPTLEAGVVARMEPGVIAGFDHCVTSGPDKWCLVEAEDFAGWVPATTIWGISSDD